MNQNPAVSISLGIFLIVLLNIPLTAISAETTANCHCFRNRTFNPADKFIADDYILSTTFNSLLASEFNVSKRDIIMMKMRDGVGNTDLMAAFYISQQTGSDVKQLLQMRKKLSWQEIVRPLLEGSQPSKMKDSLSFIQSSKSDAQIVEHITQLLIISRFSSSPAVLKELKKQNLTEKQIVLAHTLGNHAGIPVEKIVDQYLNQGQSWSEIAHNLGLQPTDTGKLLENESPAK